MMKKITIKIKNLQGKTLETQNEGQTLLNIFQEFRIDWMHACGGKGRCTTCKAIVLEGMENLGRLTVAEQKMIKLGRLGNNERLCCQTRVIENKITLEVPKAYQLPHSQYSY